MCRHCHPLTVDRHVLLSLLESSSYLTVSVRPLLTYDKSKWSHTMLIQEKIFHSLTFGLWSRQTESPVPPPLSLHSPRSTDLYHQYKVRNSPDTSVPLNKINRSVHQTCIREYTWITMYYFVNSFVFLLFFCNPDRVWKTPHLRL